MSVWLPRSRYSTLENENQANTNGDAWGRNAILSSPFDCFTKLILGDKRAFWIDNENLLGVCVLNPHNANEQSLGAQHSHTMCCAFDQGTLPLLSTVSTQEDRKTARHDCKCVGRGVKQPSTKQSKKECKDQESIQSSTTPDIRHHFGKVRT